VGGAAQSRRGADRESEKEKNAKEGEKEGLKNSPPAQTGSPLRTLRKEPAKRLARSNSDKQRWRKK